MQKNNRKKSDKYIGVCPISNLEAPTRCANIIKVHSFSSLILFFKNAYFTDITNYQRYSRHNMS
jgi:hypothetical protein